MGDHIHCRNNLFDTTLGYNNFATNVVFSCNISFVMSERYSQGTYIFQESWIRNESNAYFDPEYSRHVR